MSENPAGGGLPRGAANWAAKVDRLAVGEGGGRGHNVAGRRLTGPVQGFGKMWRKTYWFDAGPEIGPKAVIAIWKEHFGEFWPRANRFEAPLTSLDPGDVALLDVSVGGGVRLSTGVFVLYADEESFTLMTPEGHMFAGWITFSAQRAGAVTQVRAEILMRANDPLYELAMSCGGHRKEDQFWIQTLSSLARRLGVATAVVRNRTICVDSRRQWRNAGMIWHNSMVRTTVRSMTSAFARGRQPKPVSR